MLNCITLGAWHRLTLALRALNAVGASHRLTLALRALNAVGASHRLTLALRALNAVCFAPLDARASRA